MRRLVIALYAHRRACAVGLDDEDIGVELVSVSVPVAAFIAAGVSTYVRRVSLV